MSAPGKGHAASRPVVAGVGISHPERVVYPAERLTKLDIARYYAAIADWIVPHVRGVRIQEKTKVGEYLIADAVPGVVGLVQMGVLEIHTWNSVFEDLERPNRIVFDLDPGDEVAWRDVVAAARQVQRLLEAIDLQCFVKTTGGRGLHVVVPLQPHADWSECLAFSRALSAALTRAQPDRYNTDFARAGRTRKILIDYLRNNRTNTSIAAYSTRARAGAPVSVPLRWDDLRAGLDPASFTVRTMPRRLERLAADPWEAYWPCRQRLTATRLRAVAKL